MVSVHLLLVLSQAAFVLAGLPVPEPPSLSFYSCVCWHYACPSRVLKEISIHPFLDLAVCPLCLSMLCLSLVLALLILFQHTAAALGFSLACQSVQSTPVVDW